MKRSSHPVWIYFIEKSEEGVRDAVLKQLTGSLTCACDSLLGWVWCLRFAATKKDRAAA